MLRNTAERLEEVEKERDSLRGLLLDEKNVAESLRNECQQLRDIIKSAFSAMESCSKRQNERVSLSSLHTPLRAASEEVRGMAGDCHGTDVPFDEPHRRELAGLSPGIPDVCIPLNSLMDIWPAASLPLQIDSQQRGNRDKVLRLDKGQPPDQHDMSDLDRVGGWSRKPINTPPMAALDWAIVEMEELCRNRASRDLTILEFATPAFPHVSSLLNAEPTLVHPQKPITFAVVTQIMSQMPVRGTAERLAAMWLICNLVRWRLCPTQEAFAALPDFLRPTEMQLTIPHPIWVDTIVWPDVRDRLIQDFDYTAFQAFRFSLGSSISLGWTGSVAECLSLTDTLDEYSLSVEFEVHLRDLSNWTVDRTFTSKYQFLEGYIQVRP